MARRRRRRRPWPARSTTTADDAAFTTVRSGTLPNLDAPQELVFDQLTDARYVQFVFLDGYYAGSINVCELGALALPEAGAVLLGTSSRQGATTTPLGALDVDRADTAGSAPAGRPSTATRSRTRWSRRRSTGR
jgi:hypothetical protein